MVEKKCSGPCGKMLEVNKDNFYYIKGSPLSRCIICEKEKQKEYCAKNKDKLKISKKKWYEATKPPPIYNLPIKKCAGPCGRTLEKNKDNFPSYFAKREQKIAYEIYCKECKSKLRKEKRKNKINYDPVKTREYNLTYKNKNREKIKLQRKKARLDPIRRLRHNISTTVSNALSNCGSKKSKSTFKALNYTMQELKEYLELLFEPWMSWNNYGKYNPNTWDDLDQKTWKWNLDHIIPQSDLLYNNMEEENFKKCWALSNLRPYSAKQNTLDGISRIRHKKKD